MIPTQIPAEKMAAYKRTARARWLAEKGRRDARYERAWQLSHMAAELLKSQFNAKRVVVFGSITQKDRFTLWSDVDLAAWGLTSNNWLRAMADVRYLSDEVEINLVDTACCSHELLAIIERDGVTL